MKNWKKYALASASVIALGATLAACGSLTGNNKKSATTEDGKPIIKMYQIGDKPDNLDVLLKNANKIIEKKVGAKLDIQYLGWGDYAQKMNVIISSGENYDIAFANNYVINAQKGAYADLTELYKKEGKDLYKALDPAYIKGDTTKIVDRYTIPRYVENLKTLHKYYEAGYIPKDVATSDTGYDLSQDTWLVREETVGPADYGNSLLSRVANKDIQIKPITNFIKKNQTTQVANFVISNNSKNKEKAMEVLNLLNTDPELLNGLVYGPEGKNWEKVPGKENRVKVLDGYNGNTHMSGWNTGNNWILYINENVTDEQIAQSKKDLETAKESPALGFIFNTDKVKSEITALTNTLNQFAGAINTGTVDPEVEVPKMLEKLKSEGAYQKVLDEMQKQYDEFLASKK